MARILPSDRLAAIGKTRSGKSTLAAYLFSLFRVQRVLVDPKAEWSVRGAVAVRAPAHLAAALDRGAPIVRYVPSRGDRGEWEEVYALLFERRRLFVWTDEGASVSEANWSPRGLRLLQMQGAALALGHLACFQRPVKVAPELYTEAEHIFVFTPPSTRRDDLTALGDQVGMTPDELAAGLRQLDAHGFLWYDRRNDERTWCPPLPEGLRSSAQATARKVV